MRTISPSSDQRRKKLHKSLSIHGSFTTGRSRVLGDNDKALRRQLNTVRSGMRESEGDRKSEGRLDPAVNQKRSVETNRPITIVADV
jgi:hypothetical protein